MANKTATLKYTLSYPAPGGGTASVPSTTVACPFLASNEGQIDVPAGPGTEIDIPFGAVDVGATLLIVFNKLAVPVTLKINGTALVNDIPANDSAIINAGNTPGGTPITSASVTPTDDVLVDSTIAFLVFGDPGA